MNFFLRDSRLLLRNMVRTRAAAATQFKIAVPFTEGDSASTDGRTADVKIGTSVGANGLLSGKMHTLRLS